MRNKLIARHEDVVMLRLDVRMGNNKTYNMMEMVERLSPYIHDIIKQNADLKRDFVEDFYQAGVLAVIGHFKDYDSNVDNIEDFFGSFIKKEMFELNDII